MDFPEELSFLSTMHSVAWLGYRLVKSLTIQGITPLHIASKKGKCGIIDILLNEGADPNIKDDNVGGRKMSNMIMCCFAFIIFQKGLMINLAYSLNWEDNSYNYIGISLV